jgi:Fanconi anemia group M protein
MMLGTLGKYIKPMVFIGQSTTRGGGIGQKQKDQLKVVQQFREGGFNVLVSTSIGEEGLDIGEVDLIVCFDNSNSPTRLVQRMGRTGRQRKGQVIFLLTEGKEQQV